MTDNTIIRKDGATAGHIQESLVTIDDNGTVNIPTGQTYDINGSPHTHAGGSIGGSTGATDNAILRADGVGGSTVQNSLATVDDAGTVNIPTGQTYNINGSAHTHAAPDAADVTYTPAVAADWDGSADPGDADQALDQLAERVTDLEAAGGGAAYPQQAVKFLATDFVIANGCGGSLVHNVVSTDLFCTESNQTTAGDGDAVKTSVVLEAGTYDVEVCGSTINSRGILDWSVGASNFITGQDWYVVSGTATRNVKKTGTMTLATSGRFIITATINGKNASSSNYYFSLTYIKFIKQTLSAS